MRQRSDNKQPVLLFHCQHSLGMGHLIRSLTLAQTFAEKFHVVFLNGGALPAEIRVPSAIELVDLPSLSMAADGDLCSHSPEQAIHRLRRRRRRIILETVQRIQPEIVFIELFPFGRKKFAVELLPLLEAARKLGPPAPLVICSLRDILVGGRRDQKVHDVRASLIANHYFDAILVHADARMVRLHETFIPATPLRTPVYYTGFVVPESGTGARSEKKGSPSAPAKKNPVPDYRESILVSAGGGLVGGPLFRLALETHRILWPELRLPMTLVAGPFLPEEEWLALKQAARNLPEVTLKRFVPGLQVEMRKARISISQCGYNTTMDILKSRVRAVVVPFYRPEEDEQLNRARRLAGLGLIRLLEPHQATAAALAAQIREALHEPVRDIALHLDGARTTLAIIESLLRKQQTMPARRISRPSRQNWLDPVRQALDASEQRVLFFFRDDDAGWEDRRLLQLLGLFEHFALPVDLAVIPEAISAAMAGKLRQRAEAARDRLGLHQHGFRHINHEPAARKCEFGASRSPAEIRSDILAGQQKLQQYFGELLQPIFTPPWNRCSEATARCLRELRFLALSREHRAPPFALPGLLEIPVHIDWFARRRGVPLSRPELANMLAAKIRGGGPVGIMFHHAEMDEHEQAAAGELLFLLATHGFAKCRNMMYIVRDMLKNSSP